MFQVSEYWKVGKTGDGRPYERVRTVAKCDDRSDADMIADTFEREMGRTYENTAGNYAETFRYRADRGPGPETLGE